MTLSIIRSDQKYGKLITTYNGLRFYDLAFEVPTTSNVSLTINETQKYEIEDANVVFERHENSYKHPDEVVVTAWSHFKPVLKSRSIPGRDFRMELPISVPTFNKMSELSWARTWAYLKGTEEVICIE